MPAAPFFPSGLALSTYRLEGTVERDILRGLIVNDMKVVLEFVALLPLAPDQRSRTRVWYWIERSAFEADRTDQRQIVR
jgi:hypothetical protein